MQSGGSPIDNEDRSNREKYQSLRSRNTGDDLSYRGHFQHSYLSVGLMVLKAAAATAPAANSASQ